MINIEQLVRRASEETGCCRPILSAPFDLTKGTCEDLMAKERIAGFVADSRASPGAASAAALGWWTDRPLGQWRLRRDAGPVILFLGSETQVGGRMLLEAARAGVRQIVAMGANEQQFLKVSVISALATRVSSALIRKVAGNRIIGKVLSDLGTTHLSYEKAFDDLFDAVGDVFSTPRDDFVPDRALLILGSLGPGGAERQAASTAIELARHGRWKPIVACSNLENGGDFHKASVEAANVPVVTVPITHPRMSEPAIQEILASARKYELLGFHDVAHTILSYACFIDEYRPALVQCWMDYCNVLAGIAAAMAGTPSIVLSGRSVAPDNFAIFQPYMRPGYQALLARRPDLAFTNNSEAGAADYARWLDLPQNRFGIVRNGLSFPPPPSSEEVAKLRQALDIPADAPVLGTIMRFSEEKQPFLWIDAAVEVLDRVPTAYCVAFGSGVQLEEARTAISRRGLGKRIKLPGLIKEPWSALALMDVFVLTSRKEGLPNVLIEAQAMGVPVVSTGQGGMMETYLEGQTGVTARPPNAGGLAAAIAALLNDTERRDRMSKCAREFVRGRFSNASMRDVTLAIFSRVSGSSISALDYGPVREERSA